MRAVRSSWAVSSAVKWRILTNASTGSKYFRTTFGSIRIIVASGAPGRTPYFTTRPGGERTKNRGARGAPEGGSYFQISQSLASASVAPAPRSVRKEVSRAGAEALASFG